MGKTNKGGTLLASDELYYLNRKFRNFLQPTKLGLLFQPHLFGPKKSAMLFRPLFLLERPALSSLPLLLSHPSSICRIDFPFLIQCPHSSTQHTMSYVLHPQPPFITLTHLFLSLLEASKNSLS